MPISSRCPATCCAAAGAAIARTSDNATLATNVRTQTCRTLIPVPILGRPLQRTAKTWRRVRLIDRRERVAVQPADPALGIYSGVAARPPASRRGGTREDHALQRARQPDR